MISECTLALIVDMHFMCYFLRIKQQISNKDFFAAKINYSYLIFSNDDVV